VKEKGANSDSQQRMKQQRENSKGGEREKERRERGGVERERTCVSHIDFRMWGNVEPSSCVRGDGERDCCGRSMRG